MTKIHAAEAVFAGTAIQEKMAIAAVFALLGALQVVAVLAERAVAAQLRRDDHRAVQGIYGAVHHFAIHAVFASRGIENHVAVFELTGIDAIIAVFQIGNRTRDMRDLRSKLVKLLVKAFPEIKSLPRG